MGFNDRCAEALHAVREGVDLNEIEGLREFLAELLADGVAGDGTRLSRATVIALRDKGREMGIDLYGHVCSQDRVNAYGERHCGFCA